MATLLATVQSVVNFVGAVIVSNSNTDRSGHS